LKGWPIEKKKTLLRLKGIWDENKGTDQKPKRKDPEGDLLSGSLVEKGGEKVTLHRTNRKRGGVTLI